MRELTPVLLENGFREALQDGGILEIDCTAPVVHARNSISGEWKFFVRSKEGNDEVRQVLVVQRNIEHRVVKTALGAMSLAASLGATVVAVPFVEGETGVCKVDPNAVFEDDTS
ncbi:MAG: hypothetical protein AAFX90_20430 [Pseudomonadota bacterium]